LFGMQFAIMSIILNCTCRVSGGGLDKVSLTYLEGRDGDGVSPRRNHSIHVSVTIDLCDREIQDLFVFRDSGIIEDLWNMVSLQLSSFGWSGRDQRAAEGSDQMSDIVRVRELNRLAQFEYSKKSSLTLLVELSLYLSWSIKNRRTMGRVSPLSSRT
jgi:hypothetical protein